jgi:hypothetical protein
VLDAQMGLRSVGGCVGRISCRVDGLRPTRFCPKDSFASTENSQPVLRLHVKRLLSAVTLGGCLLRSHANIIFNRPLAVLVDLPVVNA